MTFQDFMNYFMVGMIAGIILLGLSAFIKICFWKAPWWHMQVGEDYKRLKKEHNDL